MSFWKREDGYQGFFFFDDELVVWDRRPDCGGHDGNEVGM